MTLKKPHDDRCRDVVRKIRHHLDGFSAISLLGQFFQVCLQNVLVDDTDVVVGAQGILKNGDQAAVNLHSHHFPGCLRQILRQRTNAGADLQDKVILCDLRRSDDLIQHMGIDEKVLAEFLLKGKVVFL